MLLSSSSMQLMRSCEERRPFSSVTRRVKLCTREHTVILTAISTTTRSSTRHSSMVTRSAKSSVSLAFLMALNSSHLRRICSSASLHLVRSATSILRRVFVHTSSSILSLPCSLVVSSNRFRRSESWLVMTLSLQHRESV